MPPTHWWFSFPRTFRHTFKLLVWELSNFFMVALSGINFPLSTVFLISHKFGHGEFSFNSRKPFISGFIASLIQRSLSREWSNFYECVYFLLFLLLNSRFNPWWSDKTQDLISIFLYLLLSYIPCFVTDYKVNFREGC